MLCVAPEVPVYVGYKLTLFGTGSNGLHYSSQASLFMLWRVVLVCSSEENKAPDITNVTMLNDTVIEVVKSCLVSNLSMGGHTDLHVCHRETLTVVRYIDEILAPYVKPYDSPVGDEFIVIEYNASPHRARFFWRIFCGLRIWNECNGYLNLQIWMRYSIFWSTSADKWLP